MTALALASFAEEARFVGAVARVREQGCPVVGLWSPIPVAGLDQPDGEDGGTAFARGIVLVAALAGLAAATALYLLEWLSAVHLYAFASGARSTDSWQAFLVAPIELGALAAGVGGGIMFLRRARLPRLHHPAFDIAEVDAASRDRFVMAIAVDAGEDMGALLALLAEAGAVHSRVAHA